MNEGTRIRVQLRDGSQIVGKPVGLDNVEVSTKFADLTIPIKWIDGIKLNKDVNLSQVFYKGDRLTGVVTVDRIKLKTAWDEVSIDRKIIKAFAPPDAGPPSFVPVAPPDVPVAPAAMPARSVPQGASNIRLELQDGSRIKGEPKGWDALKLKLAFTETTIPMKLISAVRRDKDTRSVVVSLRNGDRLTGEMTNEAFRVKTLLGEVSFDAKDVLAIARANVRLVTRTRQVMETAPDGRTFIREIRETVEVPLGEYGTSPYGRTVVVPRSYAPPAPPMPIPMPPGFEVPSRDPSLPE